ncbi:MULTISPECIES: DUF5996 family protein [unclassified Mycolicibacterium]|uniref:DUF5996 family protein n=1 Tax=unclassified Mycolicibacterium TaxID=2636767 RepID=UPI0012DF7E9D|nr:MULTISPECIES: DUF5996 family protein [unclassified Mycolicibacterium]MUL81855.1 hypothetical protein [Mycolicibacterium sp. CBMA 329]MUL87621.1 hypothetical protein [Mycolicibacterium sp. CBMA 331]MUL99515.1 hypothetical protein [Mycolicibacterium sp. CBMA 334]MUM26399.1 hypothetical protein [Mycolicibacterium sp. CBMA 295]MUM37918.1 hypothetical protein [Mycolicibacterium sp. CBMA 247]
MSAPSDNSWPALRVSDWEPTRDTLHMWTQIVGKIRLTHSPLINHWWQVTFYVSPRGLTTSSIPYRNRLFDMEFDFIDHMLAIRTSDGESRTVALTPRSVAEFYAETLAALEQLGIESRISARPNEVDPAIPFAEDRQHASYDPDAANLFWRQLVQAHRVISDFRSYFIGKVSPVHFFWGSFDMACTRFSGRPAPEHPGGAPNCADWVMVEGYSHELSSCGFWPGGGEEGAFYAYAYPEPEGFADSVIGPDGAFYSPDFRQFLLPYEAVRTSADPDRALMDFLQSTYAAAADLADWDRASLECDPMRWSRSRH